MIDPRDQMQAEHDAQLSKHSAFQAPAAMPSAEDVARAIVASRNLPEGCEINWPQFRSDARAALDLFAPILAEIGALKQVCEMNATSGGFWAKRSEASEARALAAEAALAPFAQYHEPAEFLDDKGQPLPDETHAGYVYLTIGDFRRAAAIRAQGE